MERSNKQWSLRVAILGSTMAFLDGTVVNVALPVMQHSLGGTVAEMQWIVEAYALFLAALVLVGGALGDRFGRRRIFVLGVAIFALASAACGAAPSTLALIGARAVQGVGAALLVPGSLSLITTAYPEDERGQAIGTWSSMSAITAAIGPVVGGWVVTVSSWRWLFLFNVPLGAAVVLLALRHVDESRDVSVTGRIDVVGALLAVGGLGAIVYALLESPVRVVLLGGGVGLLVVFVVVEARTLHPMVDLALFRSRTFLGANLLTLLLYAALGGAMFFVPFNLVQVQHYSPAAAGASLLPLIVLIAAMSPWSGKWSQRVGARIPLVLGPLVCAGGFALFALPGVGGSYWTTFFPGVTALGIGMGITVAPLTTAVMGSVDDRRAGVASGVNNAVSRVAGLLAIAALGLLLAARFERSLERTLGVLQVDASTRALLEAQRDHLAAADLSNVDAMLRPKLQLALDAAYVDGFRALAIACAVLAVLGALLAAVLIERRPIAR